MDMEKKKKPGRFSYICFLSAVLLLLAGSAAFVWATPDHIYSASERRMLSKRPKLKKKTILNGKFQKKFETYLCEQFPFREKGLALKTGLERSLGSKDAQGVYFGRDGYLLEKYQEQDFDWKNIEKNLNRVSRFLNKHSNAKAMFVPSKSGVLTGKLPLFAVESGEERFWKLVDEKIDKTKRIEVAGALKEHENEYIYYRTDHHWTTLGAYYAYQEWAKAMDAQSLAKEAFSITPATEAFLGTTYAKVRTKAKADTIHLYEKKNADKLKLDYNMGQFQTESFYEMDKLEGDDPYQVFMGGNQAVVDITVGSEKEKNDKKTLLLVKDSFGNCFAPFFASHYKRIVVIDLRHLNAPVGKMLEIYPADDILILYNSIQFMEDTDMGKLK